MPSDRPAPHVAIVDYGMGNLFSVKMACERFGLAAAITDSPAQVLSAGAVILPGIGAFGDAARILREKGLATALHEFVATSRPLLGICLGMQLLMDESEEFGRHQGLGLVAGRVIRFDPQEHDGRRPKVPQVGWNTLAPAPGAGAERWRDAFLSGVGAGTHMYFVHSYHVVPDNPQARVALTTYGDVEFCSVLSSGNVVGFQGHPERSGPDGLRVYDNFARKVRTMMYQEQS